MCSDFSARQPLAMWNPARGVWETPQQALCGHLEPYLLTLPRSGSMRNGRLYERPTPAHPTDASGYSSLLPTPVVDNSRGLPSAQTDYQSLANVAATLTD